MTNIEVIELKMLCIQRQLESIESGYVRVVCSTEMIHEPVNEVLPWL